MRRVMSLHEYRLNEMEESDMPLDIDTSLIDELVDIVGSEEDIENAAQAAFDDLSRAAEEDSVEMSEEDVPEKLAVAALMVKLVELGKLSSEDADGLIEKYVG
jgi:hypothetical protein